MIGITVGIVFLFIVINAGRTTQKRTPKIKENDKVWAYQLNIGKLSVVKKDTFVSDKIPPRPLDTAEHAAIPATVKAYVFSYVYDPNESERFIGFLEMPDPNMQQQIPADNNNKSGSLKRWGKGKLIRKVDDNKWVPADSNEGLAILRALLSPNEKGEIAQYSQPEKFPSE
jgi:hypothetical protein